MTVLTKWTVAVIRLCLIAAAVCYIASGDAGTSGRLINSDPNGLQETLLKKNPNSRDESGATPLFEAVRWGYPAVCSELLKRHADVNARDNRGYTPLHSAGSKDNYRCEGPTEEVRIRRQKERLDILELLLKHRADVNARSRDGYTPLHSAILHGNPEVARRLIESGADVNAQTKTGHSALHLTIGTGAISPQDKREDLVSYLLENHADATMESDCGETSLELARQRNMKHIMGDLEDHGANICKQTLHEAVKYGTIREVQRILDTLDDVDCVNVEGETALYWACQLRKVDMMELLVAKGADAELLPEQHRRLLSDLSAVVQPTPVNPRDPDPLLNAVHLGRLFEVERLIHEGANIHAHDRAQMTALHIAAANDHKYIAKLLIESGALIEAQDYRKQRPLHHAVSNGQLRTVRLLLEAGAEINAPGQLEEERRRYPHKRAPQAAEKNTVITPGSPLHVASKHGKVQVVELLITKGANVAARDNLDRTPLHWAAEKGHAGVVKSLLGAGADMYTASFNGDTPIVLASREGHFGIVKQFIDLDYQIAVSGEEGASLLHSAVYERNFEMVEYLLDAGVDINMQSETGSTAMHWVMRIYWGDFPPEERSDIESEYIKMVEFLISKGADINAQDKEGQTPILVSIYTMFRNATKLLIDAGANIDLSDNNGKTPLAAAIDQRDMDLAEQRGASASSQRSAAVGSVLH